MLSEYKAGTRIYLFGSITNQLDFGDRVVCCIALYGSHQFLVIMLFIVSTIFFISHLNHSSVIEEFIADDASFIAVNSFSLTSFDLADFFTLEDSSFFDFFTSLFLLPLF